MMPKAECIFMSRCSQTTTFEHAALEDTWQLRFVALPVEDVNQLCCHHSGIAQTIGQDSGKSQLECLM